MTKTSSNTPRRPALALGGLLLAALAAAILLAACGDDADQTSTAAGNDAVTGTSLDPGSGETEVPTIADNTDPAAVVCSGPPQGTFDATAIVGEPIDAAEKAATEQGCAVRVAILDGEGQALTQDFRPDRVNVAVDDGTVTEIIDIG